MKKSFAFFYIIFLSVITFGQSGDGSSGNPFYGTILSTKQWSVADFSGATVYVGTSSNPDLTVSAGGHLTIDAGITVVFTQLTTDLFITGTGQLTAGGSGSQVRFTKDPGKSHWGHISFESMGTNPASSTFYNCLFEYGYSTGTSGQPLLAGGALQIDFDGVTITNCSFKNNYATFAGAVMINSNRNTVISNSYFESNQVYECGGAIIIYSNSTAVIKNCIFFNNYSQGFSTSLYSGGAIWSYSNTSKTINCTFIENNSDRAGDAYYSYNSSGSIVINSLFWGSNDQFAGATTASTIITSAFEATKPANAANSIILSDVAADNFTNAGAGDYSIIFKSPCRDAGTTPSPTAPNDYVGNSRIGPYDIGAYEVQYSRWLTNASSPTSWTAAGNWEQGIYPGLSGTTGDVIIPNLTNAAYAPNISGTTTINASKSMILEAGGKATFATLTNNGTLKLKSDASGVYSLIFTSYSGNNPSIDLFLTGGGTKTPLTYKWHYISSPITSLPVSTFAPTYTLNVAQWVESRPATTLSQAWVAYDGFVYSGGTDLPNAFSTLLPGKGYDFFDGTDNTFTFGGQLNTGDINATLNYTPNNDQLYGYNLIGNPFSSGLDWNYIIANSFPLNTTKGLYFTRNSVLCTYINGVGVPGDVNGIIPPMQGFFSKTYSTGNTIVLAAAARTHNNVHATYKGSKSLIPLVRLALADSLLTDETVVRFDDLAKSYLDNDFDAVKMFLDPSLSSIHTSLGGTDYAINGLPYPDPLLEIPVTLNIATDEETKSITASELQGLDNYNVTLTDITTGFVANLRTTPTVTFAAAKGNVAGRFILKISTITTGLESPVTTNNKFNIYPANNNINIQTVADEWEGKSGSVRVLDLTGKTISEIKNTEFHKNSLTQVASPGANGIYVVEISAGNMRHVGKVVIR